jgi:hypothetical protein
VAVNAGTITRYTISPEDSSLTIAARSTLHAVQIQAAGLRGFVEASWNADGTLATEPQPKMHVEFSIDQLKSGNGMQDREMQKLVDAKRFPKAAADLRKLEPSPSPNRYEAVGEVTLSGRSRTYNGEFLIANGGDSITVEGDLTLDIRDFGLTPPSLLILRVDPVLRVRLRLVARNAA